MASITGAITTSNAQLLAGLQEANTHNTGILAQMLTMVMGYNVQVDTPAMAASTPAGAPAASSTNPNGSQHSTAQAGAISPADFDAMMHVWMSQNQRAVDSQIASTAAEPSEEPKPQGEPSEEPKPQDEPSEEPKPQDDKAEDQL